MDDYSSNEYKPLRDYRSNREESSSSSGGFNMDDIEEEAKSVSKSKTSKSSTKQEEVSTKEQFSEPPQSLQVRLPRDLCKSLKLQSIQQGVSISSIVLECLTSSQVVTKCWITRRDAA